MARRKQTATVQLKARMKEPLRAALARAAAVHGISLNAEAVARLERSFDRESLLEDALDLAFGSRIAGLVLLFGGVMMRAAFVEAYHSKPHSISPDDELFDPNVLREVVAAARSVLDWAEQSAAPAPNDRGNRSGPGERAAAGFWGWLEKHPDGGGDQQMTRIAERLAPLIERSKTR